MKLFQRNTELDAVINHAHEGILLLNTQGRITLFNKALAEMLGLKEDSVGAGIEALPPEVQDILGQPQSQEWSLRPGPPDRAHGTGPGSAARGTAPGPECSRD